MKIIEWENFYFKPSSLLWTAYYVKIIKYQNYCIIIAIILDHDGFQKNWSNSFSKVARSEVEAQRANAKIGLT